MRNRDRQECLTRDNRYDVFVQHAHRAILYLRLALAPFSTVLERKYEKEVADVAAGRASGPPGATPPPGRRAERRIRCVALAQREADCKIRFLSHLPGGLLKGNVGKGRLSGSASPLR